MREISKLKWDLIDKNRKAIKWLLNKNSHTHTIQIKRIEVFSQFDD